MKKLLFLSVLPLFLFLAIISNSTMIYAQDTTPPIKTVKLVFIHHSTGGNWLADPNDSQPYGSLALTLKNNNYYVSATNYGWGPDGIGDRTDIPNWPEWFTGPNSQTILTHLYKLTSQNFGDFGSWSRLANNPGGENEIIMFKSCFPNSDLYGEPTDLPYDQPNDWEYSIANAKAVYKKILTYFTTRQDKLFIVITAPPLNAGEYSSGDQPASKRAANARAFNNWLLTNWLASYPHLNVAVFDYYNVLTSNGGNANANDVNQPNGNHHRWLNGSVQHLQTVNNNFAAYPSGDSHPSTAGHQKATAEFVPLLNYFYNRWKIRTGVESNSTSMPVVFSHRAYPNPCQSSVTLICRSTQEIPITATIYNLLGQKVIDLNDQKSESTHEFSFSWRGSDAYGRTVPSGIYLYQIITNKQRYWGKIFKSR